MFKSILNKLILFVGLLIASVALFTYCLLLGEYAYSFIFGVLIIVSLYSLYRHYKTYDKNIIFLLNALDNGDYSFRFTENKLTKREREFNQMLNRIKEILTNARKEVIENETFLSTILESISTGIFIFDDRGSIHKANEAAKQLLGMNILTHLNQLSSIDDTYPQLFRDLESSDSVQIKIANEREEILINLSLSKIKFKKGLMKVVVLNNIQDELETNEIESWIRLIRVMTHEIMNSIAPITSLTETLLYSYKSRCSDDTISNENTMEALEAINYTAKGLLTFVDSYRRFTGVPKPQCNSFELIPLVEKILQLESYQLVQKNITYELIAPPSVVLNADESQISQVIINLIKNAAEAMDGRVGGMLLIKITENDGKAHIDICNNGVPIPEEVTPHIFIPFFTTRETGTGIGLSISRYIMRLHGGNLKHHTKDSWTIFSMVF